MVVVEQRPDAAAERRIVRHLHDDVTVNNVRVFRFPVMPDCDRMDWCPLLQVDLHPLSPWSEFHPAIASAALVVVGNHVQAADDRLLVAAGDGAVGGEVHRAGRHEQRRPTATARLLDVRLVARKELWLAEDVPRQLHVQGDPAVFACRAAGGHASAQSGGYDREDRRRCTSRARHTQRTRLPRYSYDLPGLFLERYQRPGDMMRAVRGWRQ